MAAKLPPGNLPTNPEILKIYADNQAIQKKMELGMLGNFFGSNTNTLAGTLLILFALSGITYTFVARTDWPYPPAELWKVLLPLITAILGYLFGNATRSE